MQKKRRIGIVVQARMGSKRLPGKVLMQIGGKPVLQVLLERLQRVGNSDVVAVAIPDLPRDKPIASLCHEMGVPVIIGSEEDVLSRYLKAAEELSCDALVRVTADCPLNDPSIIEEMITFFQNEGSSYDYVSNVLKRMFPFGQEVEIVKVEALKRTAQMTEEPADREHVTYFIRHHPELFSCCNYGYKEDLSQNYWTLDTQEDLERIEAIYSSLKDEKPHFGMLDILAVVRERKLHKKKETS